MTKKRSYKSLKKEADRVFSLFIRYRDTKDGLCQCYTCPKKNDPKKMQCGHFVPRQYLAVRYDETNCHAQCYACNMLYNGQPSVYAVRLERDYGKGTVERLEARRQEVSTNFDLQAIIDKYTPLSLPREWDIPSLVV